MYHFYFRLKEYCERLMFLNPVEYGRKAEEVLWRKVFYQIIQMFKHNKKLKVSSHAVTKCVECIHFILLVLYMGCVPHILWLLSPTRPLSYYLFSEFS